MVGTTHDSEPEYISNYIKSHQNFKEELHYTHSNEWNEYWYRDHWFFQDKKSGFDFLLMLVDFEETKKDEIFDADDYNQWHDRVIKRTNTWLPRPKRTSYGVKLKIYGCYSKTGKVYGESFDLFMENFELLTMTNCKITKVRMALPGEKGLGGNKLIAKLDTSKNNGEIRNYDFCEEDIKNAMGFTNKYRAKFLAEVCAF